MTHVMPDAADLWAAWDPPCTSRSGRYFEARCQTPLQAWVRTAQWAWDHAEGGRDALKSRLQELGAAEVAELVTKLAATAWKAKHTQSGNERSRSRRKFPPILGARTRARRRTRTSESLRDLRRLMPPDWFLLLDTHQLRFVAIYKRRNAGKPAIPSKNSAFHVPRAESQTQTFWDVWYAPHTSCQAARCQTPLQAWMKVVQWAWDNTERGRDALKFRLQEPGKAEEVAELVARTAAEAWTTRLEVSDDVQSSPSRGLSPSRARATKKKKKKKLLG